MGIIVIPFKVNGFNQPEHKTYKRTLEINFGMSSIMAYGSMTTFIPGSEYGNAGVGVKRVRRVRPDGSIETINLGNGPDFWPIAWCGDRIVSVTFAGYVHDRSLLKAACIVHTW